jgi:hypothetical protein
MPQDYVLGQGKLYIDTINPTTKLPADKARWIGNVPNGGLTFSFETTEYEHKESFTGQRLTDLKIELGKMLKGTLKIEDLKKENLAIFLYGTGTTVTGATITDELHTAYPGFSFKLAHMNLSAFTSLSPSPTGTAYVAGTDYTVDLKSGRVFIVAGGAITVSTGVAVKATYVASSYDRTTAFNVSNTEYWMTFDGLNNADNDKPVVAEVFKARFNPPTNFSLLSEEIISLEMPFQGLYQEAIAATPAYAGGFFRTMKPAAV